MESLFWCPKPSPRTTVSVLASAPVGRRALTVGMTETEKFLGESNEAVKTDTVKV